MTVRYALSRDQHGFPIPTPDISDKIYKVELNSTTVSSITLPTGYNWALVTTTDLCWYKFDGDPVKPSSTTWVEDSSTLIPASQVHFINVLGYTTLRLLSDSGSAVRVSAEFYTN